MLRVVVLVGAAIAIAVPSRAEACSPNFNLDHHLDITYASDSTPPSAVAIDSSYAHVAGCIDRPWGEVVVRVHASDDAAPADLLGYRIRVLGSTVHVLPKDLRANLFGELYLSFDWTLAEFSDDIEIAAVDLNGNVGPATLLHIDYVKPPEPPEEDAGGCATSPGAGVLVALGLLGLVRRRRR